MHTDTNTNPLPFPKALQTSKSQREKVFEVKKNFINYFLLSFQRKRESRGDGKKESWKACTKIILYCNKNREGTKKQQQQWQTYLGHLI